MADAPDSKSGPRKRVWVQVPPSALPTRGASQPLWSSDRQERFHPGLMLTTRALRSCFSSDTSLTATPLNPVLGRMHRPPRRARVGDRHGVARTKSTTEIGVVSPEPGTHALIAGGSRSDVSRRSGRTKTRNQSWHREAPTPTSYIRPAPYGEFQSGDRRVGPIFSALLAVGIRRAGCTLIGDATLRFEINRRAS